MPILSSYRVYWTKDRYRKAEHLRRLAQRLDLDPPPILVKRLNELWDEHPQNYDPLLRPLKYRSHRRNDDDDVPF